MARKTGVPGCGETVPPTGSTDSRTGMTALPTVLECTGELPTGMENIMATMSATTGKTPRSIETAGKEILPTAPGMMASGMVPTTGTSVMVPMENGATMANGKVVIAAKYMTETAEPAVTGEMKPLLLRHHRMPSSDKVSNFVNLINHIQSPYK